MLLWSVAEGGRGRRWRAAFAVAGALERAILIETGVDRRLTRLEIEAPAGLLTLHPDGGESALHGNVVTPGGIRHLTFDWSPDHELVVLPVAFSGAPIAWRLAAAIEVGEGSDIRAVVVDDGLEVRTEDVRVDRVGAWRWTVTWGAGRETIEVDEDGLPAGLGDAEAWPLEA